MQVSKSSPSIISKKAPATSSVSSTSSFQECEVCCEILDKSKNKAIVCSFCDYVACQNCCKTFILGSIREASCMKCRKIWLREFLVENFTHKFINVEYKAHREKNLYDREKALLPQTQAIAELTILRQKSEKRLKEASELYLEAQKVLLDAKKMFLDAKKKVCEETREFREIEIRERLAISLITREDNLHLIFQGGAAAAEKKEKKFIAKCPKEDCRGFLDEKNYCGLCGTKCCKKCNATISPLEKEEESEDEEDDVVYVEGPAASSVPSFSDKVEIEVIETEEKTKTIKDDKKKHICNPDDVETTKLLKRDTKPCPSCGAMIHKIDGCNQMWCTQCHVAFDWKTGEIEKGNVHNPEYFRYMREKGLLKQGGGRGGEVACDRIDDLFVHRITNLKQKDITDSNKTRLMEMCRNILHHNDVTIRVTFSNLDTAYNDVRRRVEFLLGNISEKKFMSMIQKKDKEIEKKTELRNIVTMMTAAGSDIILRFIRKITINSEIKDWDDFTTEIEALVEYTNKRLEKVSTIFGCKIYRFSNEDLSLNIKNRNQHRHIVNQIL
jgi:hypothetical protein